MSQTFENQNLSGALFHRVGLSRAVFEDAYLKDAKFHNVNFENVIIDFAAIKGLTVNGVRVDDFVSAELDRRDPERARLRMRDSHDPREVRRVMRRLNKVRKEFRAALRAAPAELLCQRPQKLKWSAIEHVRHLLHAESTYIDHWILRNKEPMSELGLPPDFLANRPEYVDIGVTPCTDLELILAAWDKVHGRTEQFLRGLTVENLRQDTSDVDFGQGTVGGVFRGMAEHELYHIRKAEQAIAQGKDRITA